jgi:hypothetical protein
LGANLCQLGLVVEYRVELIVFAPGAFLGCELLDGLVDAIDASS